MRVRVGGEAFVQARHLAVAGLRGVAPRGLGDLRPALRHPVLAVVFPHPVPGVRTRWSVPATWRSRRRRSSRSDSTRRRPWPRRSGSSPGSSRCRRSRPSLSTWLCNSCACVLSLSRNTSRMRHAGRHVVRIALDQAGCVGDRGVARHAGLRRPVTRQRPGLGRAGLVAGRQRLRQSDSGGRNPAGGLSCIGDRRPRRRSP